MDNLFKKIEFEGNEPKFQNHHSVGFYLVTLYNPIKEWLVMWNGIISIYICLKSNVPNEILEHFEFKEEKVKREGTGELIVLPEEKQTIDVNSAIRLILASKVSSLKDEDVIQNLLNG